MGTRVWPLVVRYSNNSEPMIRSPEGVGCPKGLKGM